MWNRCHFLSSFPAVYKRRHARAMDASGPSMPSHKDVFSTACATAYDIPARIRSRPPKPPKPFAVPLSSTAMKEISSVCGQNQTVKRLPVTGSSSWLILRHNKALLLLIAPSCTRETDGIYRIAHIHFSLSSLCFAHRKILLVLLAVGMRLGYVAFSISIS